MTPVDARPPPTALATSLLPHAHPKDTGDREGEHFRVLKAAELRKFKANAARTGATPVRANVNHLLVLTETGIDRVLLLTKKPAGVRLRAFVGELIQRLRRGLPIPPVTPHEPERIWFVRT